MNTHQFGKFVVAEVSLDDEGCTVIYPPLGWPEGAKVIIAIEELPIPYTVTPAGKAALSRKPADLEFSGSPQTLEEMRADLDKAALRGEG